MKTLQKNVKDFCEKNSMEAPIAHRALDMLSELGELAKEILKSSDYGKKDPKKTKELELELGDVQYSLLTIANYFDIDVTDACKAVLKKYNARLEKTASAGSGN